MTEPTIHPYAQGTPEPYPPLLDLIEEVLDGHDGKAVAYHRGRAYPIRFERPRRAYEPTDGTHNEPPPVDEVARVIPRGALGCCTACPVCETPDDLDSQAREIAQALADAGLLRAQTELSEED